MQWWMWLLILVIGPQLLAMTLLVGSVVRDSLRDLRSRKRRGRGSSSSPRRSPDQALESGDS